MITLFMLGSKNTLKSNKVYVQWITDEKRHLMTVKTHNRNFATTLSIFLNLRLKW